MAEGGPTYLLDTNVLSELIGRPAPEPRVVRFLADAPAGSMAVSAITVGELTYGVELMAAGRRREALAAARDRIAGGEAGQVLAVTDEVIDAWGKVMASAERAGRRIDPRLHPGDGLIAATALVHGLTIVTRNVKHFERTDAAVLDPWAAG